MSSKSAVERLRSAKGALGYVLLLWLILLVFFGGCWPLPGR